MKLYKIGYMALAATFLSSGLGMSQDRSSVDKPAVANSNNVKPFLGRWDLT